MTLGAAVLALWWFERPVRNAIGRGLVVFGRVPLFFYILQWYTAHLIGIGLHVAAGRPVPGPPGLTPPAAWIAGTLLLYPLLPMVRVGKSAPQGLVAELPLNLLWMELHAASFSGEHGL